MAIMHHVPDLSSATVVISGGTSGVGLATATLLARSGAARIALVGRNVERGENAVAAVRAETATCEAIFVSADINAADSALGVAATVAEKLGVTDILINATVGKAVPTLFHKMDIHRIAIDLTELALGPMMMCSAFLPGMREKGGGVIVNIASDAAKAPTPGESVIGAGMAAITMFTRTLAVEAKRNGVRVNALTPSLIEGTMTYDRVFETEFSAKLFDKAAKLASLGIVQPDDLAEMILFLVSPQAARLTGQVISVNGGISAA